MHSSVTYVDSEHSMIRVLVDMAFSDFILVLGLMVRLVLGLQMWRGCREKSS